MLTELTAKLDSRKTGRANEFYVLARTIADGEETPAIGDVERVLADAEKTSAELEAAVQVISRRRKLRATLEEGEAAKRRVAEAQAAKRIADSEFEATRQAHIELVAPLLIAITSGNREVAAGKSARRELLDSAPRELRDQLAKLQAAAEIARAEASSRRGARDDNRGWAKGHHGDVPEHESRAAEYGRRADVAGEALQPIEARLAELDRQIAQKTADSLSP